MSVLCQYCDQYYVSVVSVLFQYYVSIAVSIVFVLRQYSDQYYVSVVSVSRSVLCQSCVSIVSTLCQCCVNIAVSVVLVLRQYSGEYCVSSYAGIAVIVPVLRSVLCHCQSCANMMSVSSFLRPLLLLLLLLLSHTMKITEITETSITDTQRENKSMNE